jgi:hypothetical protein
MTDPFSLMLAVASRISQDQQRGKLLWRSKDGLRESRLVDDGSTSGRMVTEHHSPEGIYRHTVEGVCWDDISPGSASGLASGGGWLWAVSRLQRAGRQERIAAEMVRATAQVAAPASRQISPAVAYGRAWRPVRTDATHTR